MVWNGYSAFGRVSKGAAQSLSFDQELDAAVLGPPLEARCVPNEAVLAVTDGCEALVAPSARASFIWRHR